MFRKVLIANRGEIAVRVMRTLREMGIASVAVYSEADAQALHVRMADEAYCVGPAPSAESYLQVERILDVARRSGAEAIHPGYGFLSENADFARRCAEAGLVFIGPPAHAIVEMGEKTRARRVMMAAGVPVVPGTEHPIPSAEEALTYAESIGFPVLIKAAAGGGGKGMRRVDDPARFVEAFHGAQREAGAAFGNDACYVEKFILRPKHVEIQVLFDGHGQGVHLFERDCSVQRRHQKVIEESPCAFLQAATREKMGAVAVQAGRAVDYVGAGTVEFLLDAHQNFYFLEMNTRLQVEHPVTEACTGIDLVEAQLRVAAGEPLPFRQEELQQQGHAIEVRVYAEDADQNFLPSPGRISALHVPPGHGVRDDGGFYAGAEVTPFYDPMVAKLIVHAESRPKAIARLKRLLQEYALQGVRTNLDFLGDCMDEPSFVDGSYDTGVIDGIQERRRAAEEAITEAEREDALLLAVLHRHLQRRPESVRAQESVVEGGWALQSRLRAVGRT